MIEIHLIDAQGVYVESLNVSEFAPIPTSSVFIPPPAVDDQHAAQWNGSVWSVVTKQSLIDAEAARRAAESAAQTQRALTEIEAAIDAHLDAVAQQYRFADRTRLALRAGYPNPWQAIGVAFGTWMDACNAMAAQGMQDFLDGKIPLQTPEQVIAQLPLFISPSP